MTKVIYFGDVDFANSNVINLGNLESIGGSADFRYSCVIYLSDLKSVGGLVDFSNSRVANLNNLKNIGDIWFGNKKNLRKQWESRPK